MRQTDGRRRMISVVTTLTGFSLESPQQLARHRGQHRRFRLLLSDRETTNQTMPKTETDQPETEMQRQYAQKIVDTRFRLDRLARIEPHLEHMDDPGALKSFRLCRTRLSRLLRACTAEYKRLLKDRAAGPQPAPAPIWSNIPQA
jgi:hypothetical protein